MTTLTRENEDKKNRIEELQMYLNENENILNEQNHELEMLADERD